MNQPPDIAPPPPPTRSKGMSAFLIVLMVLGGVLALTALVALVVFGLVLFMCSKH